MAISYSTWEGLEMHCKVI